MLEQKLNGKREMQFSQNQQDHYYIGEHLRDSWNNKLDYISGLQFFEDEGTITLK